MKSIKANYVKRDGAYSKVKYWDHEAIKGRYSEEGELIEPMRANPDSLDAAMSVYEVSEADKEVQARVQKLLSLAKQILTENQYRAFVLMAVKDPALTEREAAKVMGLSRGRVHQLWTVARMKLQAAYDKRTD